MAVNSIANSLYPYKTSWGSEENTWPRLKSSGSREESRAGVSSSERNESGGGVRVELSAEGRAKAAESQPGRSQTGEKELSESEKKEVSELEDRDREVRAHEQAHLAAAGGLARGSANYSYQTGPNGKRYAVGGEVNIDVSPVDGSPSATIQKAARIKRAALAPADPSAQDRSVAAQAEAMATEARQELSEASYQTGSRVNTAA